MKCVIDYVVISCTVARVRLVRAPTMYVDVVLMFNKIMTLSLIARRWVGRLT